MEQVERLLIRGVGWSHSANRRSLGQQHFFNEIHATVIMCDSSLVNIVLMCPILMQS